MFAAGLIAGILASVLFNLGIALQAIEARRTPAEEGLHVSLIWRLLHRPLWLTGLGVEWVGVPLEILSFAWAPFIVVQPLLACGLLVLLAIGRRLLDEPPNRGVVVGVVAIIAAVVLIAWGAPGAHDTHRGPVTVVVVMAGLVLVSLIPFALRGRRFDTALSANLGSACGFAATNIAMKLMADDFGSDHFLQAGSWLAVGAGVGFAATVTGMTALQRAPATTVIPISTAVQTFLPIALEPLFLEESFRHANLEGLPLLVGLFVMLIGIVIVARSRSVAELLAPAGSPGAGTAARAGPAGSARDGRAGSSVHGGRADAPAEGGHADASAEGAAGAGPPAQGGIGPT